MTAVQTTKPAKMAPGFPVALNFAQGQKRRAPVE